MVMDRTCDDAEYFSGCGEKFENLDERDPVSINFDLLPYRCRHLEHQKRRIEIGETVFVFRPCFLANCNPIRGRIVLILSIVIIITIL